MKKILGRIWAVWAGLWFATLFLAMYPLFRIWFSHPSLYKILHFQRRIWGVLTCMPALMLPIMIKEEKIPKHRKVIYCANHSSYLDILTCGTYLPGFNFFMAKMELGKVPLFRMWFRTIDVPVQRDSLRSSHQAFVNAGNKVSAGMNMIIFPEGRIPDDRPKLHRFKPGAFRLAIEKGALIVPVTLPDNLKRTDSDNWTASPGRMRIHIHRPIDTAELKDEDADALQHQVYNIIESQLIKYGVYNENNT
jgi:1-acyl-sn-glycerol-3-phosphate acyltransferase